MESIPSDFEDLFERPSYGVLATLLPNGIPHQTVVWVDYDGEHVRINTARGRRKVANIQQDPRIALCVIDPDVPYRYLSLHGEVTAVTEEGAMDHIDALGQRYQNVESWSDRYDDDVVRVILEIEPEGVFTREPYGIEQEE
ncbi:PPOX class F420-dependent oxidoreductase [Haloprofundus salinisoli]|uniref:PPOX class F420-dependent oxidoreductase n=1 Tax=Haloprofundus salinisoli TaxID=2876193 RepID=UPI001CCB0A74|nr:PPOX class F420-dependent oxidoreductase [Haloprofundus salinisoli]